MSWSWIILRQQVSKPQPTHPLTPASVTSIASHQARTSLTQSCRICNRNRYKTYFCWIDNVYSHRSTQPLKRGGGNATAYYYDCRLKGRPAGGSPSSSANKKANEDVDNHPGPPKKKRKRKSRPLNQCSVKVKLTYYLGGPGCSLESVLRDHDGGGLAPDSGPVKDALARGVTGERPFWVMQRIVNHNGVKTEEERGKEQGDEADGRESKRRKANDSTRHTHTLDRSDEIKKCSVLREHAARLQQARKRERGKWMSTGEAAKTVENRSQEAPVKFYSACFWYVSSLLYFSHLSCGKK